MKTCELNFNKESKQWPSQNLLFVMEMTNIEALTLFELFVKGIESILVIFFLLNS
jgi:hypothetical protein